MRDTERFPIVMREIVACLEEYRAAAIAEERLGDMRPMLLEAAISLMMAFAAEDKKTRGDHETK